LTERNAEELVSPFFSFWNLLAVLINWLFLGIAFKIVFESENGMETKYMRN